eukprot:3318444-Pyramimonas_sp.AAC.1
MTEAMNSYQSSVDAHVSTVSQQIAGVSARHDARVMAIRLQHIPEQQALLVGNRAAAPSPGLILNQPPPTAGAPPPAAAPRAVSRSPRGAA